MRIRTNLNHQLILKEIMGETSILHRQIMHKEMKRKYMQYGQRKSKMHLLVNQLIKCAKSETVLVTQILQSI